MKTIDIWYETGAGTAVPLTAFDLNPNNDKDVEKVVAAVRTWIDSLKEYDPNSNALPQLRMRYDLPNDDLEG